MAPKPKLTIQQIGEVRRLAAEGMTKVDIAAKMEISRGLVALTLAKTEPGSTIDLHHTVLSPDPGQPRKTFDEESITELAVSIREHGLLQNLVVRPAEREGHYDIIDGERRWRAVRQLVANGQWDAPLPCLVKDVEPADQLVLQLLANLQRENVPPLEEADAFARLHAMEPETWTAQAIAESIGKTSRFVQQRIALATRLHPKFKECFAAGLINIEGSRLLCQQTIEDQAFILDEVSETLFEEDGTLKQDADPFTVDEIEDTIEYVERQQKIDREREQHRQHNARIDAQPSGPINPIPAASTHAEDDNVDPEPKEPSVRETPAKYAPVTKGHLHRAHNRKTIALRAAVCKNHMLAARIVCFSLLAGKNPVANLEASDYIRMLEDRVPVAKNHQDSIEAILGKLKLPAGAEDHKNQLKLWSFLEKLPDGQVMKLFAHVVARHIGTFAGFGCETGDAPVVIAIAAAAGLQGQEEDSGLTLLPEDLNGVQKPTLLAIADDAGTPAINDEMKKDEIAAQIAKHSKSYVLPTLRFATTAEIEKALLFK